MEELQIARHPRHFTPMAKALRARETTAVVSWRKERSCCARLLRQPCEVSLPVRLARIAAAFAVTVIVIAAQLGIAAGDVAEADARQLASVRSRELAQRSCRRFEPRSTTVNERPAAGRPTCAVSS
jgi:hypothetical protein